MSAESASIIRLVTDADGVSHFVAGEMDMVSSDFAPPAAPLDVSEAMPASAIIYWRAPSGWDGQMHPSPARQWVYVLAGSLEIEASDGTKRRMDPGDGVLLEDVTGEGHTTRIVSDTPAFGMFVQVPN